MKSFILISASVLLIHFTVFAQGGPLPTQGSTLFKGSGNCAICHTGDGTVLSVNGVDVSPPTYWRSTMMGNSSKDPFWRAIVAEEVHNYPQLQELIETTCTRCHAPMGYTEAFYNGQTSYTIDDLRQDPLANDGVSCTACHQIKENNFGSDSSYSGHYIIENDHVIYGPYENPDTQAMLNISGYLPVYTTHMNKSELCATCHTLFTPYLDNQGQIAGDFPEQTPYIEWKNSVYPGLNTQCQDCHMPKIYDPIDIATIPPQHQVLRTPYWKHNFVGGNVYMLQLMKNNIDSLAITATPEHFDSTIARAEDNLTNLAIGLFVSSVYEDDSLNISVKIENKAGHKIPSGIPFRRMWIHLKVEDAMNNVVYESGKWDNTGEIIGLNADYEPHYNVIRNEDEIQIYEGVFVDVDQNVTYTLLRAAQFVKDNRIPPKGFTTTHISYDTIAIYGNALNDPDFNKESSVEGSGSDIVLYKVAALPNASYTVTAEVCFQTIKPRVVGNMQTLTEPDITKFLAMYNNLPNLPFIMKNVSIGVVTDVPETEISSITSFVLNQNYPNPFNPITKIKYSIAKSSDVIIKVYSITGDEIATLVNENKTAGNYQVDFDSELNTNLSLSSGVYFCQMEAIPSDGSKTYREVRKMVLLK